MSEKISNETFPVSEVNNLVVQELLKETLVYNLSTDRAHCLNEISARVWRLCDGTRSVKDISRLLSRELKTPVTAELVYLALHDLKKESLIVKGEVLPSSLNGLSRREMIRKVGIASTVMLPMISSIIAPTAAHAQSRGGGSTAIGSRCTSTAQCVTGATCYSIISKCCIGGIGDTGAIVSMCPPGVDCKDHCENDYPNALIECCSGKTTNDGTSGCKCV